jgi:very-short-patch-repair endonuclease
LAKIKGKTDAWLYDFHRQKPIDSILELFCHELMLGIEVDGYSHEFLEVYEYCKRKTNEQLGVSVLR